MISDWISSNYIIALLGNRLDLVTNKEKEVEVEEAKEKCDNEEIFKRFFMVENVPLNDLTDKQFKHLIEVYIKILFNKVGIRAPSGDVLSVEKKIEKDKWC